MGEAAAFPKLRADENDGSGDIHAWRNSTPGSPSNISDSSLVRIFFRVPERLEIVHLVALLFNVIRNDLSKDDLVILEFPAAGGLDVAVGEVWLVDCGLREKQRRRNAPRQVRPLDRPRAKPDTNLITVF